MHGLSGLPRNSTNLESRVLATASELKMLVRQGKAALKRRSVSKFNETSHRRDSELDEGQGKSRRAPRPATLPLGTFSRTGAFPGDAGHRG